MSTPRYPRVDYLSWVKDSDSRLHGCTNWINLSSSSVKEPIDLLLEHVSQSSLDSLLSMENAWGHPVLLDELGLRYDASSDEFLLTSGASSALFLVCQALLTKGDHVVIESPSYEPLLASPQYLGARISWLVRDPEKEYAFDLEALKHSIEPSTRLIMLSNPHNPSGATLNNDILLEISSIARQYHNEIWVLVDEVYHDFIHQRQVPAARLNDSFISINSLSKVYGLSLLRCGWIHAAEDLISRFRGVYVLVENIGSRLTEAIAAIVLSDVKRYDTHWRNITALNRAIVQETLEPLFGNQLMGSIPSEGCAFFPKLLSTDDTRDFVQRLANDQRVLVTPGYFFGAPEHVRIGFGGVSSELQIGLEKIAYELISKEQ